MILLTLHKLTFFICLFFGILHLFKKNRPIKFIHRWSGFIALISIFIYLFQMSSNLFGYIIYMLIIALTATIPFFKRQKKCTAVHIAGGLGSIVWLVLIHI